MCDWPRFVKKQAKVWPVSKPWFCTNCAPYLLDCWRQVSGNWFALLSWIQLTSWQNIYVLFWTTWRICICICIGFNVLSNSSFWILVEDGDNWGLKRPEQILVSTGIRTRNLVVTGPQALSLRHPSLYDMTCISSGSECGPAVPGGQWLCVSGGNSSVRREPVQQVYNKR